MPILATSRFLTKHLPIAFPQPFFACLEPRGCGNKKGGRNIAGPMPQPQGREAVDIRQLDYFIAVARLRSYTKAADELFITRQALSKAVHNLEQELGEALIANRDGALEATEAGRALMADAQPVVEAYRALERRYLGEHGRAERAPSLAVSLVPGAALTLPKDIIDRFAESHPDLLLSVESSPTDVALSMVKSGESDIGIVGSAPEYLGEFDIVLLVETGTYVHVPLENPLAQRAHLTVADLDEQPFVTFGKRDHLHRHFMDACAAHGIAPNIVMTSSNIDVLTSSAAQNEALMFGLPPNENVEPIPDYLLVPVTLRDDAHFGTYAVKRKGDPLSPAALAFWEYLEG